MNDHFVLLAGTANPALAEAIARGLGVQLGACTVEYFRDTELSVRLDEPVRGRTVFLIQPTSPPVNDHLIELLAFADACRRASAARVIAIIPYFGYARSDKRAGKRSPIVASMVAGMMQAGGIDHVVTIALHSPQIEGFFHIPVDNLSPVPVLCNALRKHLPPDTVVVSPDAGRVAAAGEYASLLNLPVVVLNKRRTSSTETVVTHISGEVQGKSCLIIDDMISTGGTLLESIQALTAAGANREIVIAAIHGLLVDGAVTKLERAGVGTLFLTDTVPLPEQPNGKLEMKVISIGPLLVRAIKQICAGGSLSALAEGV